MKANIKKLFEKQLSINDNKIEKLELKIKELKAENSEISKELQN